MPAGPTSTPLLQRMRWRRDEVVASMDATAPEVKARTFVYFFGLGAILVLVVPLLPSQQLERPVLEYLSAAVALATSLTCLVVYDRMPEPVMRVLPFLGTTLVTAVIVGSQPANAPAYFLMYLWVVLSSAYFHGLRAGVANVAAIAAQSALAFWVQGVPSGLSLWFAGVAAFTVTAVALALLRERADTLILNLGTAAATDALTGLPNRRAFAARLDDELYRAGRTGRPLALLAVDVDDFKSTNDRWGHAEGDKTLQLVARTLVAGRRLDLAARLGGDEFALLLPETDTAGAQLVAGRILRALDAAPSGRATRVSIGIATALRGGDGAAELHLAADQALYEAKAAGGHGVVTHAASGAPVVRTPAG